MRYLIACCLLLIAGSSSAQTKKTIYIADRVMASGKKDCLQIKEKKKDGWQNIGDTIIGLNYEEGFEYKAKVVVNGGTNYSLVKLVSKKKTGYNPAIKLEGKKWVLASMFDSINTLSLGDSTIFMTFDITNKRVGGHGVCNKLKGELKAEGRNISFSDLSYTKMKCVDQGNIMEKIVINLLGVSNTWQLKGRQLIIYSAKGSYLVFKEV